MIIVFYFIFLSISQNEYFGQYMAMSVFAVTAFMAAVITMTLPESKNIKLPDTIDEAKRIGINKEYSA